MIFSRNTTQDDASRAKLADELAQLRAEIRALRTERDSTAQVTSLREQAERLKLERGRLIEENDRKIRETEHKVGLLKTQQEHDVANARRETMVQVREENLSADRDRFKGEMDFQRQHLEKEVERVASILGQVLERLPNLDATLELAAGARASRKES